MNRFGYKMGRYMTTRHGNKQEINYVLYRRCKLLLLSTCTSRRFYVANEISHSNSRAEDCII